MMKGVRWHTGCIMAMHLMEPSGNVDMVTSCSTDTDWPRDTEARCHALAQRNGGKVSQKRSGKEEGGGGRVE